MTPKDDLFRLVQAMTAHEKQVFSKAAKGNRANPPKYLKLFQALCELKKFEGETAFLGSAKGRAFAKGFSVQKSELYDKILQVLRSQRQSAGNEKPLEFQVREYVEEARILKDKKLWDLSRQRLAHARTESEKFQFHEILLEILRLERNLTLDAQEPGYEEAIYGLHKEIDETTRIVHNKYRMLYLRDQLFLPSRQHASLTQGVDLLQLQKVMDCEELQNVSLCLSFEATSNYHFCHAIFHSLKENSHEAWIHFRSIYLMWQEQKGVQKVKPMEYRNMVQNYLSLSNDALRYEDFDIALQHLEREPFASEEAKATARQYSMYIRLQKHLNLCDWDAAFDVFKEYKAALHETSDTINPSRMMTYYMSFARLFLVMGKWQECKTWARKVIAEGAHNRSEALVPQARLQEIIAMYELQETVEIKRRQREAIKAMKDLPKDHVERRLIQWIADHAGKIENASLRNKLADILPKTDGYEGPTSDPIANAWLWAKAQSKPIQAILSQVRDRKLITSQQIYQAD